MVPRRFFPVPTFLCSGRFLFSPKLHAFYIQKGICYERKTTEVREAFLAALENVSTMDELEKIRVEYIGKKGYVTELLKEMKNLSTEEK